MEKEKILTAYKKLRKQVKKGCYTNENTLLLGEIYLSSLNFLKKMKRVTLISKVQNKSYFAFTSNDQLSRAVNQDLFMPDYSKWEQLRNGMEINDITSLSNNEIQKILYSMAVSFCASIDLIKKRDQKTPGTFFEYFIAYFFSWRVGVEPRKYIQLLNIDAIEKKLPTDFIFNLGKNQKKFHLPVKISTRERAIMLWAHQRLIDGVYGSSRFIGTPVIMTETKTSQSKKEVIEICLPEQWMLYQNFIAQLKRIYYLDLPEAYKNLDKKSPSLIVKPFSEFFEEWQRL